MSSAKVTPKAEETNLRIRDSALALFREEGFDNATMREIAQSAFFNPLSAVAPGIFRKIFEFQRPTQ